MPRKDNILNLPGFAIKKVSGYNPLILDVHIDKSSLRPLQWQKIAQESQLYA